MSGYLKKSKAYKNYHYSVLQENELEYLHKTTLKMLKQIIPVFDDYGIRYFICGGTLLGAVQNKKFIPWDDDLDLCVLDKDYNRMVDILSQKLPKWMALQWKTTEKNYYHGWVKIRDKNSKVYPYEKTYLYNGVWIDIYRLSKFKRKKIDYLINKEHFDYLMRRYRGGGISLPGLAKRMIEHRLILKLMIAGIKAIVGCDQSYQYVVWSASKIILDENWLMPRSTCEFEGMRLYSFAKVDQYLRRHYGSEYMRLPSDLQRRVGICRVVYNS